MCEPSHSIVQYPEQDDDGNPTAPRIESHAASQKVRKWLKRIGDFFHLSRFGKGHSEAEGQITIAQRRLLPASALWEGHWWDRTLHEDGIRRAASVPRDREAAQIYFERMCVGDMRTFRRFIEHSIEKTDNVDTYVSGMADALTSSGWKQFIHKVRMYAMSDHYVSRFCRYNKEKLTKIILGFTRKRNLWVPEWADEPTIWTPGQRA